MVEETVVVDVVKIEEHEGPLMLPIGLSLSAAIKVLTEERQSRETVISLNAPIEGFVPDVAHAFFMVMKARFGWVQNRPTPGFFGNEPPMMLTVATGLNSHVQVPWGRTTVPGVDGYIEPGARKHDGRYRFVMGGEVKRKHEHLVMQIVEDTKRYVREHSVYKGKAFRLTLNDSDGDALPMPEPRFLDINRSLKDELVFSADVQTAIETSVFAPIVHTDVVRALGVPRKRGILLSGPYGTGKSMTSTVVADLATTHGWTFILCERPTELADILRLAREYGPAVVFCEDIDRVMTGQRTMDMDEVLNVVDGIESKNAELMVVLTTNHVENIHQAMLRPGRLDAVIDVRPPDAKAAERLIRLYGRGLIDPEQSLARAGKLLDGQIPAVIQEVVERSKLAATWRNPDTKWVAGAITEDDLVAATTTIQNQLQLLAGRVEDDRSDAEKAASILVAGNLEVAKLTTPHSLNNGGHAEYPLGDPQGNVI